MWIRDLFDELDADGGGELDTEELKLLLNYIGKKFMGFQLMDDHASEILKVGFDFLPASPSPLPSPLSGKKFMGFTLTDDHVVEILKVMETVMGR